LFFVVWMGCFVWVGCGRGDYGGGFLGGRVGLSGWMGFGEERRRERAGRKRVERWRRVKSRRARQRDCRAYFEFTFRRTVFTVASFYLKKDGRGDDMIRDVFRLLYSYLKQYQKATMHVHPVSAGHILPLQCPLWPYFMPQ
jgi:hypothetical protein